MAAQEQILATINAYRDTFTAHDREAWLDLFTDNAHQEDPVGAPPNTGRAAIGAFWDTSHGMADLALEHTAPPIICGKEALMFLRVLIGKGADRMAIPQAVDVVKFSDDARINSLRAFWDPSTIGPYPE